MLLLKPASNTEGWYPSPSDIVTCYMLSDQIHVFIMYDTSNRRRQVQNSQITLALSDTFVFLRERMLFNHLLTEWIFGILMSVHAKILYDPEKKGLGQKNVEYKILQRIDVTLTISFFILIVLFLSLHKMTLTFYNIALDDPFAT